MQIAIDRKILLDPLSKIVRITEHRSIMPILTSVRLTLGTERSSITATDLEVSAVINVKAETPPADIVLRGSVLHNILKALEQGDVTLTIDQNTVTISQGKFVTDLALQDIEEFPEVKLMEADKKLRLKTKTLFESIEKVEFATGHDETRYVLTGLYFKHKAGNIEVVATDGHRIAFHRQDIQEDGLSMPGVIIPKKAVSDLMRIVGDEEEVVSASAYTGLSTPHNF
ncbi:MAG: DNA polymerase III subunit beta [Syntrophorhabdaceae bacterium PtaU1.Bin034]|nr:MAG: DNA polymerase III subunit beta [Syntrophorhabdaceae bacterium PtaU1.Bin034]